MAECKYCAFARYPDDFPPYCDFRLTFRLESHPCPLYEREAGADDDLGDEMADPLPTHPPGYDHR